MVDETSPAASVVWDNEPGRRSKADKDPAAISGATHRDFPGKRLSEGGRPIDDRSILFASFAERYCSTVVASSVVYAGWGGSGGIF